MAVLVFGRASRRPDGAERLILGRTPVEHAIEAVRSAADGIPVVVVDGLPALRAAIPPDAPDAGVVLLHDAGRPGAPAELAAAVLAAMRPGVPAVVPLHPVTETVKVIDADSLVVATLPREELSQVQTPFAVTVETLRGLLAGLAPDAGWDDLVTALPGAEPAVVAGSDRAFLVETDADADLVEAVLAARGQ